MATWVRSNTSRITSNGANLTGTMDLDNDTAPGDFDPAGVTSVHVSVQVDAPDNIDDFFNMDTTEGWEVRIGGAGATLAAAAYDTGTISNLAMPASNTASGTDSSPNTTASTAQWEGAEVDDGGASNAWAVYNAQMKNDNGLLDIDIGDVTVTITYTPSATSFTVGLATETDTAQAKAGVTYGPPQAVETDTAQAVAAVLKTYPLTTIPTETDSAGLVTKVTAFPVNQAVETDTAQPIGGLTFGEVQAVETDSAQAVAAVTKTVTVGQATETDTAQAAALFVPTLEYVYDQDETLQSHTGDTNYTAIATVLGSALKANTKYLILAATAAGGTNISQRFGWRVRTADDTNIETKSVGEWEPQLAGPTGLKSYMFSHSFTTDASPADVVFEHRCATLGSDTVYSRGAVLLLINLDAIGAAGTDYFESIDGASATFSTTAQTTVLSEIAGSSLTVGQVYLVLGHAQVDVQTTVAWYDVSLYRANNASTQALAIWERAEGENVSEIRNVGFAQRHQASSGTPNITMYGQSETATTHASDSSYLIAIPISLFEDWNQSYTDGVFSLSTGGTDDTVESITAYTPTTSGADHLLLGQLVRSNAQVGRTEAYLDDGTSPYLTGADTDQMNQNWDTARDGEHYLGVTIQPISGSNQTVRLRADAVGSNHDVQKRWIAVISLATAGGAINVQAGLATETDTAQPIGGLTVALAQGAVETDSAFAVTVLRTYGVAQAQETDTAFAKAGVAVDTAQAVETDTAQPAAPTKTYPLTTQGVETDSAFAVSVVTVSTVNQAIETDTAQLINAVTKALIVGQSTETDTAAALGGLVFGFQTQALETDTAFAVTFSTGISVNQATETDTAQGIAAVTKDVTAGQAIETDSGLTASTGGSFTMGLATETDTALAATVLFTRTVAAATETDTAQSIAAVTKDLTVTEALESDTANPVTIQTGAVAAQAVESDSAFAVTVIQTYIVGSATETDTAQPVTFVKAYVVGTAIETDTATLVSVAKTTTLQLAVELDTALAVSLAGGFVGPIDAVPPHNAGIPVRSSGVSHGRKAARVTIGGGSADATPS